MNIKETDVERLRKSYARGRADMQQETIDAVNDYVTGKISFERLAEVMNINYYELASMVHKYSGKFKEGE